MLLGRGSDSHDGACCYHKVISQVLPVISQGSCQDTHSVGRIVIYQFIHHPRAQGRGHIGPLSPRQGRQHHLPILPLPLQRHPRLSCLSLLRLLSWYLFINSAPLSPNVCLQIPKNQPACSGTTVSAMAGSGPPGNSQCFRTLEVDVTARRRGGSPARVPHHQGVAIGDPLY